jgi:hypothetical protein
MSSSLRATADAPAASSRASSSLKGDTVNNSRVYVIRGELVASPFPTSVKYKAERGADAFGKVNSILNPPGQARTSTYHTTHNKTAVHVQTAGSVHKRKVPYSVNAPRNRVLNLDKKRPPPFSSTLDLKNGGIMNSTVYPYRTISKVVQEATEQPMETRTGCACARATRARREARALANPDSTPSSFQSPGTNPEMTAGIARREHQRIYR